MERLEVAVINRIILKAAMKVIAETAFPGRGEELGELWYGRRLDLLDENTKCAMDMFQKIQK